MSTGKHRENNLIDLDAKNLEGLSPLLVAATLGDAVVELARALLDAEATLDRKAMELARKNSETSKKLGILFAEYDLAALDAPNR